MVSVRIFLFLKQDKRVKADFGYLINAIVTKNCKIGQCFILFGFGQEFSFRCIPNIFI